MSVTLLAEADADQVHSVDAQPADGCGGGPAGNKDGHCSGHGGGDTDTLAGTHWVRRGADYTLSTSKRGGVHLLHGGYAFPRRGFYKSFTRYRCKGYRTRHCAANAKLHADGTLYTKGAHNHAAGDVHAQVAGGPCAADLPQCHGGGDAASSNHSSSTRVQQKRTHDGAGVGGWHVSATAATFATTECSGAQALLHCGYKYHKHAADDNGNMLLWRCSQFRLYRCRISVKTSQDGTVVYTRPFSEHNHPSELHAHAVSDVSPPAVSQRRKPQGYLSEHNAMPPPNSHAGGQPNRKCHKAASDTVVSDKSEMLARLNEPLRSANSMSDGNGDAPGPLPDRRADGDGDAPYSSSARLQPRHEDKLCGGVDWTLSESIGQFVMSKRGAHILLLHHRHLYYEEDNFWRCSKWSKYKCGAKVKCADDGSAVYTSGRHTHPPGTVRMVRDNNTAAAAHPAQQSDDAAAPKEDSAGLKVKNGRAGGESSTAVASGGGTKSKRPWRLRDGTAVRMTNERDARLLKFDGYMYKLNHRNVKITYWYCCKDTRFRCNARLRCSYEESDVHTRGEHNHEPDPIDMQDDVAQQPTDNASSVAEAEIKAAALHTSVNVVCEPYDAIAHRANAHSDSAKQDVQQLHESAHSPVHSEHTASPVAQAPSVLVERQCVSVGKGESETTASAGAGAKCSACSIAAAAGWPLCKPCFHTANDEVITVSIVDTLECAAGQIEGASAQCLTCKLAAGAQWPCCFTCFNDSAGEAVARHVKECFDTSVERMRPV